MVSVVVPCYNLWNYTEALLTSFIGSPEPPLTKLLLVDNASTDETSEKAPAFGPLFDQIGVEFEYVRLKQNYGFSAAINAGWELRHPDTDFCVFNNDMIVRPGWLSWLGLALEAHPALGMVSASLTPPGMTVEQWRELPNPAPEYTALQVRYRIYDLPWLFRRECFEQVGGFDEKFIRTTWEDHDWLLRMELDGWEFGRCMNSVVFHHWNQTQFLIQSKEGNDYFLKNRDYFISKWGTDRYQDLLPPIRENLKRFL